MKKNCTATFCKEGPTACLWIGGPRAAVQLASSNDLDLCQLYRLVWYSSYVTVGIYMCMVVPFPKRSSRHSAAGTLLPPPCHVVSVAQVRWSYRDGEELDGGTVSSACAVCTQSTPAPANYSTPPKRPVNGCRVRYVLERKYLWNYSPPPCLSRTACSLVKVSSWQVVVARQRDMYVEAVSMFFRAAA